MKLVQLIVVFLAWAGIAQAQDLALFDGAWIHGEFIQEMKRAGSVSAGMDAKKPGAPLWLEIDASNDTSVTIAYGFGASESRRLWKEILFGDKPSWVIGKGLEIEYVVMIDTTARSYVALYSYKDQEATPIVLGRLPSKRQDAAFLLERMINSSVLVGRWSDASGGYYEFKNNMTGTWDGINIKTRVDVEPESNDVLLTIHRDDRAVTVYRAQRIGANLSLSTGTGRPLVLSRLRD